MGGRGNAAVATALATAAVRETWEETGVMIAAPATSAPHSARPSRRCGAAASRPRSAALSTSGGRSPRHAIPSASTPVLLTFVGHGRGDLHGDGELDRLSWVPLADVTSLPTIDVTRFMAGFAGEIMDSAHPRSIGRPVFSMRGPHRLIRYL